MINFRTVYRLMGLSLVAAVVTLSVAWADEKVTITTDSAGKVMVRHDAIVDIRDDTYGTIIVKTAPPELKNEDEFIKVRPDEKAVWIPGYWRWNSSTAAYDWMSGVWRRPIPDQVWHAGKWNSVGDTYVWQSGYWGPEGETKIVYVKEAPPALREETRGAAPSTGDVWIAGDWKYDGAKYVWVPGSWQRPAASDLTWVPGAWLKTSSGHEYIPGHWDYSAETRTYIIKSK
jgi:hypothetical protein